MLFVLFEKPENFKQDWYKSRNKENNLTFVSLEAIVNFFLTKMSGKTTFCGSGVR